MNTWGSHCFIFLDASILPSYPHCLAVGQPLVARSLRVFSHFRPWRPFLFGPRQFVHMQKKTPKVFLTEGQGRKRENVLEFSLQALLLKTCTNVSSFVHGLDLMLLTC